MDNKYAPSQPPPYAGGSSSAPVIVQAAVLGPKTQRMSCPHCHADINTGVRIEPTTKTHIIALIICLICCPCVCVPYCVDDCQGTKHYCPACQAYLGQYEN